MAFITRTVAKRCDRDARDRYGNVPAATTRQIEGLEDV